MEVSVSTYKLEGTYACHHQHSQSAQRFSVWPGVHAVSTLKYGGAANGLRAVACFNFDGTAMDLVGIVVDDEIMTGGVWH